MSEDDVGAIHRRICRLHSATWDEASLFIGGDGTWRVLRGKLRPKLAARLEKAGMLVGVYTSHVSFERLLQDIEAHINELERG